MPIIDLYEYPSDAIAQLNYVSSNPPILNYPTLRTGIGTPTGTAIHNATELQAMNDDLADSYYLANAIDASATSTWNGGSGFVPIGTYANQFTGTFDGNGYTITDLFIDSDSEVDYVALFGFIDSSAEIKNVGLIDVDISNTWFFTASLVAATRGAISNCYAMGSVRGGLDYTGGLVATNDGLIYTTTNCYSTCFVSGTEPHGFSRCNAIDCFWDTQTSGQATSGGGTGKTTAQMKTQSTFTNWDFSTIWEML